MVAKVALAAELAAAVLPPALWHFVVAMAAQTVAMAL